MTRKRLNSAAAPHTQVGHRDGPCAAPSDICGFINDVHSHHAAPGLYGRSYACPMRSSRQPSFLPSSLHRWPGPGPSTLREGVEPVGPASRPGTLRRSVLEMRNSRTYGLDSIQTLTRGSVKPVAVGPASRSATKDPAPGRTWAQP